MKRVYPVSTWGKRAEPDPQTEEHSLTSAQGLEGYVKLRV